MAITAATRTSIIQLVVTANNAAPGTTLLNSLVAESEGGASLASIAATLTASSTFASAYPSFQTATEFATEFLGNLIPQASAAALAEGITVIEGLLSLYFFAGLGLAFYFNDFALLPFHILLSLGFLLVFYYSVQHTRHA